MSGLIRQAMASTGSPTLWRRISSAHAQSPAPANAKRPEYRDATPRLPAIALRGEGQGGRTVVSPQMRERHAMTQDRPRLQAPPGATDTHMHFYDTAERYPVAPTAAFLPPPARVDDYREVQRRLGLERVVVVQPSAYGTDNRCTMDAVAALGDGGAGGGRGRPQRERRRAGAPHGGGRARHPLPHAQGRRAALGNPRGHGGARASVRLARAAAVQRPRAARAGSDAEAPAGRSGDRSRRPVHGPGAAGPPGISPACSACSRADAPGSSCPRPTRALGPGRPLTRT